MDEIEKWFNKWKQEEQESGFIHTEGDDYEVDDSDNTSVSNFDHKVDIFWSKCQSNHLYYKPLQVPDALLQHMPDNDTCNCDED